VFLLASKRSGRGHTGDRSGGRGGGKHRYGHNLDRLDKIRVEHRRVQQLSRDWKRTRPKVDFEFFGVKLSGFVKPSEQERVMEILKRSEAALANIGVDEVRAVKSILSKTNLNQKPLEWLAIDLVNFFRRRGIDITN